MSLVRKVSGVLLGQSSGSSRIIFEGQLYRLGIFKDWSKRHVELTDDSLNYYAYKGKVFYLYKVLNINLNNNSYEISGGIKLGGFILGVNSELSDSDIRPFCFCISDSTTLETIYFACNDTLTKDAWKEKIIIQISFLRISNERKENVSILRQEDSQVASQVRSNYMSRPIIYIRIIRAQNLYDRDISSSEPSAYVTIKLGSSTGKTITVKKDSNPEWDAKFTFDRDLKDRFASLEVFDYDSSTSLGIFQISVYSLRDGIKRRQWYQLYRRNSRLTVPCSVEVEIATSGVEGPDSRIMTFFREVQHLDDFRLNFISKEILSKESDPNMFPGYPFYFPSCENEILEDFSIRVHMVVNAYCGKLISSGVLFLTNYRFIFITQIRLLDAKNGYMNPLLSESDLSTQIPIGMILDVNLSLGCDGFPGKLECFNILMVDGRNFSFVFGMPISDDYVQLNGKSLNLSSASRLFLGLGNVLPHGESDDEFYDDASSARVSARSSVVEIEDTNEAAKMKLQQDIMNSPPQRKPPQPNSSIPPPPSTPPPVPHSVVFSREGSLSDSDRNSSNFIPPPPSSLPPSRPTSRHGSATEPSSPRSSLNPTPSQQRPSRTVMKTSESVTQSTLLQSALLRSSMKSPKMFEIWEELATQANHFVLDAEDALEGKPGSRMFSRVSGRVSVSYPLYAPMTVIILS
jgi:hypothetical protein